MSALQSYGPKEVLAALNAKGDAESSKLASALRRHAHVLEPLDSGTSMAATLVTRVIAGDALSAMRDGLTALVRGLGIPCRYVSGYQSLENWGVHYLVSMQPIPDLDSLLVLLRPIHHGPSRTYNPAFVNFYARQLRDTLSLPIPFAAAEGSYERYCGDASVPGKGEVLIWRPHCR